MRSSYWIRATPKSDGSCLYKDRRGAGTETPSLTLGITGKVCGLLQAPAKHCPVASRDLQLCLSNGTQIRSSSWFPPSLSQVRKIGPAPSPTLQGGKRKQNSEQALLIATKVLKSTTLSSTNFHLTRAPMPSLTSGQWQKKHFHFHKCLP